MAEEYCLLLRRDLRQVVAPIAWPAGIQLSTWRPEWAQAVHQLLELGVQLGGAHVPALEVWRELFEYDAEYDPALCFIASDAEGVVGVAHGWTSAYLENLVVHPRAQRRGLGRALLLHGFCVYQQRREGFVDLKVREDNYRARRLYESIGMVVVRRELAPV